MRDFWPYETGSEEKNPHLGMGYARTVEQQTTLIPAQLARKMERKRTLHLSKLSKMTEGLRLVSIFGCHCPHGLC